MVGEDLLGVYIETGSLDSVVGILSLGSKVDLLFLNSDLLHHGSHQYRDRECCFVWGSADAGCVLQRVPQAESPFSWEMAG